MQRAGAGARLIRIIVHIMTMRTCGTVIVLPQGLGLRV